MVKKKKPVKRKKRKVSKKPLSRSLRVYQKIAISFVIVASLLLLAVLYLSVSRAQIKLSVNTEIVSTNVAAEIVTQPVLDQQVEGMVKESIFTKAKTFEVDSSQGTPVEEKAEGIVTLINETNAPQDLVATTRILSEEGVLFRLEEAVTVPAQGQIDVLVKADQPGIQGEIGPSQFTIPGLRADTQEMIYAVSIDSMRGGLRYIRILTQADLDAAAKELEKEILEEARGVFEEGMGASYSGNVYEAEAQERVSDVQPGEEVGIFNVSLTMNVQAVYFQKEDLIAYAEADLNNRLQEDYMLYTVNRDGLQIDVQLVDLDAEKAQVNLYMDGESILTTSSTVLDLGQYLGRSGEEVLAEFEEIPNVESVSISFTPFWLKRIPTLQDHISVKIIPVE